MSSSTTLELDRPAQGVARLTLHGPGRMNAFNLALFEEFRSRLTELDQAPDVRAIVITGTSPAFCAGLDINEAPGLADATVTEFLEVQRRGAAAISAARHLGTPVIAAVDGPALGAGFALVLASDVRFATPASTFSAAFVRIGLTGADCGVSWLLPRTVGIAHASDLLLTGRTVDAEEAARMGILNRVVAAGDLADAALEFAGLITRNSPVGVEMTKRALQTNLEIPSLDAAVAYENRGQSIAAQSPEFGASTRAFLHRRTAATAGATAE